MINDPNKTIAILFAALEKALLAIPSGKIKFEFDPRDLVFLRALQQGVKITKTLSPDGISDPYGRHYEARVLKGYRLTERAGQTGIQCLRCEQISFHPEDIKQKFCAKCNIFHADEEVKERSSSNGRLIDLT